MPILTIKSVENKGNYALVTDTKGNKYSVWPDVNKQPNPAYGVLKPGTTADFEITHKGDFSNIVGLKMVQAPGQQQADHIHLQIGGGPVDIEIIKRASIEAQTAYNGIIALAVAGKCPPETLTMALNWAKMRLCPPVSGDFDN